MLLPLARPAASLGAEEVLPSDACVCCCGAAPRCEVLSAGAPLAATGAAGSGGKAGLSGAFRCGPGAAQCAVSGAHGAPGGRGCTLAPASFEAPAAAVRHSLRWQKAGVLLFFRHASHFVRSADRCPSPHKESRGFERERVRKPRLRFCIVSSIASAKETHNGARKRNVFSFRQHARW